MCIQSYSILLVIIIFNWIFLQFQNFYSLFIMSYKFIRFLIYYCYVNILLSIIDIVMDFTVLIYWNLFYAVGVTFTYDYLFKNQSKVDGLIGMINGVISNRKWNFVARIDDMYLVVWESYISLLEMMVYFVFEFNNMTASFVLLTLINFLVCCLL